MRWHTTGDIKNGAFSKWADDLAQAFVRLEPQALNDQEFKGEIAKVNTDEIQLSRVTATGHRVRRLKEHIDSKWLNHNELSDLDWAGADIPIVNKLIL